MHECESTLTASIQYYLLEAVERVGGDTGAVLGPGERSGPSALWLKAR